MTIETRHAPLTPGHTETRFAVLRSIVDEEWLPAPLLDSRAEADSYARGFHEACEMLRTSASIYVLDLSTGHIDDLDTLDDSDLAALKVFVAEAFGIDLDGNGEEDNETQDPPETIDALWHRLGKPARMVNRAADQQITNIEGGEDGMLWGRISLLSNPKVVARTPFLSGSAEGWEVG